MLFRSFFELDNIVLEWIRTYLTGRTQYVSDGGCRCVAAAMTSGVPQGSVLGLLLFSMFNTPVGKLINSFGINYNQCANTQLSSTPIHSPHFLASRTACTDAGTVGTSGTTLCSTRTKPNHSLQALVSRWLRLTHPLRLRCPVPPCRSL